MHCKRWSGRSHRTASLGAPGKTPDELCVKTRRRPSMEQVPSSASTFQGRVFNCTERPLNASRSSARSFHAHTRPVSCVSVRSAFLPGVDGGLRSSVPEFCRPPPTETPGTQLSAMIRAFSHSLSEAGQRHRRGPGSGFAWRGRRLALTGFRNGRSGKGNIRHRDTSGNVQLRGEH